jgi:hypothetical protein
VEQEAAVLMALGGACLAAEVPHLGAKSYRRAAVLAEQMEAWTLACQAWLGVGGACLPQEDHASAAVAYQAAAVAAERAEVATLRTEALRMARICMLRLGSDDVMGRGELPTYRSAKLGFRCAQRVEETNNPEEKR